MSIRPLMGPIRRARDVIACLLLMVGTVGYLYLWPRDMYGNDEGFFLYEAKRVLDGEVLYRDFFDILTPGSYYVVALLYALFGVSFETARMGMAVLHGLIAVLLYRVSLRLGIRRAIAIVVCVAHVAICYPAIPFASAHWFGTFVALCLFLLVLRGEARTTGRALAWGIVIGILILVEQHKGVVMACAAASMLAVDHLLERESHASPRVSVVGKLASYAAGVLIVVLPVLLGFMIVIGVDPIFRALVHYPLVNYRRVVHGVPWGIYWPYAPTLGSLLKYLPLVIPVAAARVLWQRVAKKPPAQRRQLLVATIFAVFGILSIMYLPDAAHIALVGPLWFPLVGELLDQLLRRLELLTDRPRMVATAAVLFLIAGLGVQLHRAWRINRENYRFSRDTAFGRIDFINAEEIQLLDALEPLLRSTGAREIFAYPCYSALYLFTATANATRFQTTQPGFTDRDQIDEIIATLETRRVPFVVRNLFWWPRPEGDPFLPYLGQHYRPIKFPRGGKFPTLMLYQRKDSGLGAEPVKQDKATF